MSLLLLQPLASMKLLSWATSPHVAEAGVATVVLMVGGRLLLSHACPSVIHVRRHSPEISTGVANNNSATVKQALSWPIMSLANKRSCYSCSPSFVSRPNQGFSANIPENTARQVACSVSEDVLLQYYRPELRSPDTE